MWRYSASCWLLCGWLSWGTAAGADGPATLTVRLLGETGEAAAGRLRILDSENKPQPVQPAGTQHLVAAHPKFPELGVIVSGETKILLSSDARTLRLDHGPEYRLVDLAIKAQGGEEIERTVRFERWIHMKEKGWWSGDLHVHRSPADLPLLMRAADIHYAPALTCWNDTVTMTPWPKTLVETGSPDRVYSIDNCEDERRWGAALFIGVKSPLHLYPRDTEYPPPSATWREARSRGAFIDLEKLIWWQAPMMAALSPPDSIGVAVNHFREDGISTRASLSRPRDEAQYPGEWGFAQYILDLYSTYLSAGFRIPASAGSANGVVKVPFGYNRSYVYLGKQFSHEDWLAGQKAGRNFVTNGPMLFVTVNGQMPGAVLSEEIREVRVQLEAISAAQLDRAEVLVNGRIAETLRPSEGPSRITVSVSVRVTPGSWLAVRCFEKSDATIRLAHTSPFYVGKSARRSKEALQYLQEWVQTDMRRIKQVGGDKLTEDQRKELLELCRKALAFYQQN